MNVCDLISVIMVLMFGLSKWFFFSLVILLWINVKFFLIMFEYLLGCLNLIVCVVYINLIVKILFRLFKIWFNL